MKTFISKSMSLVALVATLFSFTKPGGEGFEIFFNNKVVVQQFGKPANEIKSLRVKQYAANDKLMVKYYHCGQVARNKILTIKDNQNRILKEWRFTDATSSLPAATAMNCDVKDILPLNKGNESTLKLYYASSKLPKGRFLINIVVENNNVALKK